MGELMVILAGVCWGIISIFIRAFSGQALEPLQICAIRVWVSVLMLAVCILIRDRSLLKIRLRDLWIFVGSGVFSLTFFSYCYFTSIVELGASVAVILLYTSPVFVMIMGRIFFHEKITATKLLALLLTFAGCVMVSGIGGFGGGHGVIQLLIGIGAGFGYALYSIFGGLASRRYSSLTVTFYTFLISGISLLFISRPVEIMEKTDISMLPYILGVALICTTIPYISYTYGLKRMEASKAAVLVTVEPLVGCLLGMLVYHESHDLLKLLGIVSIFAAVILLSVTGRGQKAENTQKQ